MLASRHRVLLAVIVVLVVALDQFTKWRLSSALGPAATQGRITLGLPWIALDYTENRGAAFGLFASAAPLLALAAILIVVALLVQYLKEARPPMWQTVGVGAITGGAVGNIVDRIRLGYVVDFISIGPWPNFNVADSAVTLGVLLLAWGWWQAGAGDQPQRIGEEHA